MQAWESLGNHPPAVVKSAENRLWKALIDMALMKAYLRDIIMEALTDICAMFSGDLEEYHPYWFRAGQLMSKIPLQ